MPEINSWILLRRWLFMATIYLKREYSRLADWTGLGNVGAVVLSAAFACAMAAILTMARGYGQTGNIILSMVLALGIAALALGFIISLKTPGGVEKYYTEKREELSRLQKEFCRIRAQTIATQQLATQERSRENARRSAEDLASQQAMQNAMGSAPASSIDVREGAISGLSPQAGPRVIVVTSTKSVGIGILLTILFGPLGMFYSTITGAIVMIIVAMPLGIITIILGVVTLGVGLLAMLPFWICHEVICIIWGALAVTSYNAKLTRGA